jgi:hypothetical protein
MALKAKTFDKLETRGHGRIVKLARFLDVYILTVGPEDKISSWFCEEFTNFQEALHVYRFVCRTYHRVVFTDQLRGRDDKPE